MSSISDAKGHLIPKEITWPPLFFGVAVFIFSVFLSGVSFSIPWAVLAVVAVVSVGVWFFFDFVGAVTTFLGGTFAYSVFAFGDALGGGVLFAGPFLVLLAGVFALRSGFGGMGWGDVRMAGVAAATLWWVSMFSVVAGLILFSILVLMWAIFDRRRDGGSFARRQIPLAPAFCFALLVASAAPSVI